MRDWCDVLPDHVAGWQTTWERNQRMARMRDAGFTKQEIAERHGISAARVGQIIRDIDWREERGWAKRSPIDYYFDDERDLEDIIERATAREERDTRVAMRHKAELARLAREQAIRDRREHERACVVWNFLVDWARKNGCTDDEIPGCPFPEVTAELCNELMLVILNKVHDYSYEMAVGTLTHG